MDVSKTLNLPQTDFPMRANLPQREPELVCKWDKEDIYNAKLEKNKNSKKFILHDGPPYANGGIHLGTSLNKILKDMVVKFYSLNGYNTPYIPGWDTHGLPIEQRAIKELGLKRHEVGPVKFRNACKDFALKYLDIQREAFKRLGVIADWENPYITLDPKFEAKQIEVFGEMAKKGFIYKGLRPVYWCHDCETALADAEIEYMEENTVSIYVKFFIKDDLNKLGLSEEQLKRTSFVIWTTTTWTLPGNLAVCLNGEYQYSLFEASGEYYILANELAEGVMKTAGIEDYKLVKSFLGNDLEGIICNHPFIDRNSVVILGEHVTLESGTGCVHTAPGHGAEDFEVCKKYNIDVIVPVDYKGKLTNEAGKFEGMFYKDSNKAIIEELKSSGHLLTSSKIDHQYPHCWRCKSPIIFRATEQWFASIDGFRDKAIDQISKVNWVPEWGQERITTMVRDRGDWCISRQRIWGVPIPIFYCTDCGKELITDQSINAVKDLFAKSGSNSWYEVDSKDILPKDTKCTCGCNDFKKETDIMDVWFDSGTTYASVIKDNENMSWPCDMYLEGSDQHRGWFQSSLLTSVATSGIAPYKTVLTHGYVVDGEGRKMSKSLGNGIDPEDIIKEYGADILRLWVASSDYKTDIRISKEILKQLSEVYRKIRNTSRYILGNINDFNPDTNMVAYEDLNELDQWALLKLYNLVEKVSGAYKKYEFHLMFHAIHNFCVVDMSNFYLDIIKDRLYTSKVNSKERRAAQSVMYLILESLSIILTPVLAFTSEEIWQYLPHRSTHDKKSIQLNNWPILDEMYNNKDLEEKWNKIIDIRSDVSKVLEIARNEKIIGHSLSSKVTIFADSKEFDFILSVREYLKDVFIVSAFELKNLKDCNDNTARDSEFYKGIKIKVSNAEGEKCERCWMYSESVGKDSQYKNLCERCLSVLK